MQSSARQRHGIVSRCYGMAGQGNATRWHGPARQCNDEQGHGRVPQGTAAAKLGSTRQCTAMAMPGIAWHSNGNAWRHGAKSGNGEEPMTKIVLTEVAIPPDKDSPSRLQKYMFAESDADDGVRSANFATSSIKASLEAGGIFREGRPPENSVRLWDVYIFIRKVVKGKSGQFEPMTSCDYHRYSPCPLECNQNMMAVFRAVKKELKK